MLEATKNPLFFPPPPNISSGFRLGGVLTSSHRIGQEPQTYPYHPPRLTVFCCSHRLRRHVSETLLLDNISSEALAWWLAHSTARTSAHRPIAPSPPSPFPRLVPPSLEENPSSPLWPACVRLITAARSEHICTASARTTRRIRNTQTRIA